MKYIYTKSSFHNMKRILLSGILAASSAFGLQAALTQSFYANSSVLKAGKWVKIGVEQTGVYEISYQTLREMGFQDPSKVSVFGRGGRVLSESFVTNAGVPILTDDLTEVKVIHEDDMLYFYGLGPEEIAFESSSDYPTGGFFNRKSNNIYTRRGYYFLTDSKSSPAKMTEKNYDATSQPKLEKGVSYIYHELDSVQNSTQSGQLFWGESVNLPGANKRFWDVTMPDAIEGSGVMQCVMYFPDRGFGDKATVTYGFKDNNPFSTKYVPNTALYYAPHEPTVATVDVPGTNGTVMVGFENADDVGSFANLDFWVVSYERSIPTMKNSDGSKINQQLLAFPDLAKNSTGRLELEDASSYVVLDVTSVTDPQRLKLTQKGDLCFTGVRSASKPPVIVIFDKDRPQLQISGYDQAYSEIENQDLHAYKYEGADFIIITTPAFKPYAEEIAELHRQHDGMKVVVATTEQCYNEFSGGTPDPMAYRSFARMLYFSDRKPKNMLLLGPLYGDFRGLQSEHNPLEGIIAYQSPSISTSRGAHNINDFYGMMSDKFRTDYYERNDVQIGVGILPLKFESEAQIVVKKIKDYLERDDHAYFLNVFTGVGGIGDDHTHDIQVRDIDNHIGTVDFGSTIFTPLAIDTYGNAEARKKFLNRLNDGCNMFSYFGHGAEQFLGKDKNFFNAGDVFTINNKILPFALFGGCQITNTDRGFRGLGETIVTATPHGCIGSIVSARDTWSGQNYEFFKQFFTSLYKEGSSASSKHRDNPVTIGEVYAAVKNYSTYSNELAYQLLCDPALIIPIANRSIAIDDVELKPGDMCTVTGRILKSDKNQDSNFNGNIVIRLNEPERTVAAGKLESGQDPKNLSYAYRDSQVAMVAGEVNGGTFSVDIFVPSAMSSFSGQDALIYMSAFDSSTKIGAGGCMEAAVLVPNSETAEAADDTAPVIDVLSFDAEDCSILLSVSDNLAINMSNSPLNKGLSLFIDGKERTEVLFAQPSIRISEEGFTVSKNVALEGLAYGEHAARLKVKDVAGNISEKEILFTYNPYLAKYVINRDEDNSSVNSTFINIQGIAPANSRLIILSSEGTEVWRSEFEGASIEWNHEYTAGGKVPAGHYKAYIMETGNAGVKGHSDPIDIPVI